MSSAAWVDALRDGYVTACEKSWDAICEAGSWTRREDVVAFRDDELDGIVKVYYTGALKV